MAKKRVLLFSTAYAPFWSGAEIAIRELTSRMPDYEFEMLTVHLDPTSSTSEQVGKILVHRVGVGSLPMRKFTAPFIGALKVFQLIRARGEFDIFWPFMVTYVSGSAYIFNILRFWHRVPVVLTLQEGDSDEHLRRRHHGLLGLAWRAVMTRTNYLVGISKYLANRAMGLGYVGKSAVIPNGVADEFFNIKLKATERNKLRESLGYKKSDIVLIHTGRLNVKNAISDIIKSLVYLPTNCKFLSIGDGELADELALIARDFRVADRVTFLPAVSQIELARYLAMADIFVRPSLSEGLGISFLEALAVGLPIVATEVGGIPDFLVDNRTGLFCRVGDPEDLASKVKMLIANPILFARISKEVQLVARASYKWEKFATDYSQIFQGLREGLGVDKIVIASPLAPNSTSSTYYATRLSEELINKGIPVRILTFATNLPTGLRHIVYFFKLVFASRGVSAIIALDNFSVALVSVWAGLLTRTKVVVRVGGDFLWEHYANRTGELITLSRFNSVLTSPSLKLSYKEKVIRYLINWIYIHADHIVFSTLWQRDIVMDSNDLVATKSSVITNAYLQRVGVFKEVIEPNFIWIGRDIPLKNVRVLQEAYTIAKENNPDITLTIYKDLSQKEVWPKLLECYALILPSLSEVSPNLVLQAISFGKPFVMPKDSGYADWLREFGIVIDTTNKAELAKAMLKLTDKKMYLKYKNAIAKFAYKHTYADIAKEFLALIEQEDKAKQTKVSKL